MIEFLSPPGMEPLALLGLIAASFGTSFITAAFGIGGGVLMLALLASLLPPAALIPVHGLVQLGSNGFRALVLLSHTLWPVVAWFLAGSLVGVALGGAVVVQLPGEVVQIGVGLFILWSVFFTPPAIMRKAAGLTGAISTFLTMFFGATGPFVASYLKTLRLERHAQLATHSVCMTIQHLLKCVAFGFLGFAFGPYLGFIVVMIAAGALGTLLGKQVLARIEEGVFRKALSGILMILALRLLWSGGAALLAAG
jgi:uncharacterized membrane protein YfcA